MGRRKNSDKKRKRRKGYTLGTKAEGTKTPLKKGTAEQGEGQEEKSKKTEGGVNGGLLKTSQSN